MQIYFIQNTKKPSHMGAASLSNSKKIDYLAFLAQPFLQAAFFAGAEALAPLRGSPA